ncbi:MAG: hypothetical protein PUD93_03890 [Lachnospiraceae bacterium]|nr:hypothetical protein [Lachnospiraceae bacterium]
MKEYWGKIPGFKVVGYTKEFFSENAHEMIPKFWGEVFEKNESISEYGICIDDIGDNRFYYMIARIYDGGEEQ